MYVGVKRNRAATTPRRPAFSGQSLLYRAIALYLGRTMTARMAFAQAFELLAVCCKATRFRGEGHARRDSLAAFCRNRLGMTGIIAKKHRQYVYNVHKEYCKAQSLSRATTTAHGAGDSRRRVVGGQGRPFKCPELRCSYITAHSNSSNSQFMTPCSFTSAAELPRDCRAQQRKDVRAPCILCIWRLVTVLVQHLSCRTRGDLRVRNSSLLCKPSRLHRTMSNV
jgi:hypothetical protein